MEIIFSLRENLYFSRWGQCRNSKQYWDVLISYPGGQSTGITESLRKRLLKINTSENIEIEAIYWVFICKQF